MSQVETSAPKPTFPCPACGLEYSRAEYLRRHERKHTETRPFQCDECPKNFARSDVLLRHRRRCHPEEVAAAESIRDQAPAPPSENKSLPSHGPTTSRLKTREPKRPYSRPKKTNSHSTLLRSPHDLFSPVNATSLNLSFLRGSSAELNLQGSNSSQESVSPTGSLPPPYSASETNWHTREPDHLNGSTPNSSESPDLVHQLFGNAMMGESSSHAGPTLFVDTMVDLEPSSSSTSHVAPLLGESSSWPMASYPLIPKPPENELMQFGSWLSYPSTSQLVTDESQFRGRDRIGHAFMTNDWAMLETFGLDIFAPEHKLIDSEARIAAKLRGPMVLDHSDPFFVPQGLFASCYRIPHWHLPPVQKMSLFAARTFDQLMGHLGVVHEPTFRLKDVHSWFAFAMCTVNTKTPDHENDYVDQDGLICDKSDDAWENMQSLVRTEKTEMFIKSFARGGHKMSTADTLALVQALLTYNAPQFLSSDPTDRLMGELFLGTITRIARQSGLFNPEAEFAKPNVVPSSNLEWKWRKWISLEGFRRTAWLVYLLDTLASLEASVPSLIAPREIRHLPLPSPQSVWAAKTEKDWADAMALHTGRGLTLSDALSKLFNPDASAFWAEGESSDTILDTIELGPFARLVIVVTLLRGVIEFGQGQPKGGYVVQTWAPGAAGFQGSNEAFDQYVISLFTMAFDRWRKGWDFDRLCSSSRSLSNRTNTTYFINDATPYYWMSILLLNTIKGQPEPPLENGERPNKLESIEMTNLLSIARQFAKSGEAPI